MKAMGTQIIGKFLLRGRCEVRFAPYSVEKLLRTQPQALAMKHCYECGRFHVFIVRLLNDYCSLLTPLDPLQGFSTQYAPYQPFDCSIDKPKSGHLADGNNLEAA